MFPKHLKSVLLRTRIGICQTWNTTSHRTRALLMLFVIAVIGLALYEVQNERRSYTALLKEANLIRGYDGSNLRSKNWSKIEKSVQKDFLIYEDMKVWDVFDDRNDGGTWGIPPKLRPYLNMQMVKEGVDLMIELNRQNQFDETTPVDIPGGSERLWHALQHHMANLEAKVAVVGSFGPWIEAVLLAHGVKSVDAVEYKTLHSMHERIRVLPKSEITTFREHYDFIVSFSSISRDGLGWHDAPISPNGDRAAMIEMWSMLKKDGTLFLNVPCNHFDVLVYNQKRVYGPKRFEMITKDIFHPIEAFKNQARAPKRNDIMPVPFEDFFEKESNEESEPLFVLRKITGNEELNSY